MIKKISIILIILSTFTVFKTVYAQEYRIDQQNIKKSTVADENNAYVLLSNSPKMSKMSFIDGNKEDRYSDTYNEKVIFGENEARQFFVENSLYIKLDESFYNANDSVFAITVDYWDYSGAGVFYIDYTTGPNAEDVKRITVPKLGIEGTNNPKWWSATVYVDDAQFGHYMNQNADIRVATRAFNSFAKVEVRNLSKTAGEEDFGVFNTKKAQSLDILGLCFFADKNEDGTVNYNLDKKLTKEEAIKNLLLSYGIYTEEDSVKDIDALISGTDIQQYIKKASELGIIENENSVNLQDYITQRELIQCYLRLLKINRNETDDIILLAKKEKLLHDGCMIFQPEKVATLDTLASLAMNAMAIPNKQTNESLFGRWFSKGKYSEQSIANANDDALNNWLLENEFKIVPKVHVDPDTGRTFYSIDFFGSYARKQYFTQQCWSTDNERLYFMDNSYRIWEYNTKTYITKFIDYVVNGYDYNFMVSKSNHLYYLNTEREYIKLNLDTYEKQVVAKIPEWQKSVPQMLQVNDAETKMSVEWKDNSGEFDSAKIGRLPVCDLTTGEWDLRWRYGFDTEWYYPDHPCINPVYDEYLFFAHEGTYQKDRIWVLNTEEEKYFNIIPQKRYTDSFIGEIFVHEWWSYDGEWILAVKTVGERDGIKRGVGEAGIVMARKNGTDKRYIKTNEVPCHAQSSTVNNRWVIMDTIYGVSDYTHLYLVDLYSGENIFLASVRQKNANPGHQHPNFSQDGNQVSFGLWSDDGKIVEVGWMDVSDIVSKPISYGEEDISKTCSSFWCEGCEHYFVHSTMKDVECYKVPVGNCMYVNVKNDVSEEEHENAIITITYLDNAYTPLVLDYCQYTGKKTDVSRLNEKKYYIARSNTGKWITKTIEIDNIDFSNMIYFGADLKLHSAKSDLYIKDIEVSVK